ncbi:MAG: 50S ribosomal protein L29 [Rikenellaceae bacterium]
MKKQDLRELAVSELQERIASEKMALQTAKLNHQVSPLEDSTQLLKSRRNIARMMTILNQKTAAK